MKWVNCGNCGRTADVDILPDRKSKFKFGGATQYQKKCPFCHVAVASSVVEDESDLSERVAIDSLPADVIEEITSKKCGVATARDACAVVEEL